MEQELCWVAAELAAVQAQQQQAHADIDNVRGQMQAPIEQNANLMIQLVTANPRIKEIYDACNVAAQILLRLQEDESRDTTTAP